QREAFLYAALDRLQRDDAFLDQPHLKTSMKRQSDLAPVAQSRLAPEQVKADEIEAARKRLALGGLCLEDDFEPVIRHIPDGDFQAELGFGRSTHGFSPVDAGAAAKEISPAVRASSGWAASTS